MDSFRKKKEFMSLEENTPSSERREHHVFSYLGNPRLFMETQIYVRGVVCTYRYTYIHIYMA